MIRVLVIDDEAPVRAFIQQTLEAEGYQVAAACDGAEGLKVLPTFPVDLIITDIFMPNKEGIETILTVRKQFAQIKVLAISGGGSRNFDVLPSAKLLGAHHVLAKPFTPDELLAAVQMTMATEKRGGNS